MGTTLTSGGGSGAGGWRTALDRFAARLADQRAALAAGEAGDVPPFDAPEDLGPLPQVLRMEALRLLEEAEALARELQAAADATAAELAAARPAVRAAAAPAFLDQRV